MLAPERCAQVAEINVDEQIADAEKGMEEAERDVLASGITRAQWTAIKTYVECMMDLQMWQTAKAVQLYTPPKAG
jgi:hypothetical protein